MTVDLNADLGKGFERWSSATTTPCSPSSRARNVACGFHAGDPTVMRRAVAARPGKLVMIS
jgi:5-oxoprolinase (ATP-hydrolysing) subunit A